MQIQKKIRSGIGLALHSAAQNLVHASENLRGIICVGELRRDGDLDHGGNQGGGNFVTGNIGNEDADAGIVERKNLIEVTDDGGDGTVPRQLASLRASIRGAARGTQRPLGATAKKQGRI